MTPVRIKRKGEVIRRLFGDIDPDDVRAAAKDRDRIRLAHLRWVHQGGPTCLRCLALYTEPSHQSKGNKSKRPQYILHHAPARLAGSGNMCPWSTPGCRAACLDTAGHGSRPSVAKGRAARNRFMEADPLGYLAIHYRDLDLIERRHPKGRRPSARPNGTADLTWEATPATRCLIEDHKRIMFGDYTKASPSQRPNPDLSNYTLVRSVWTDRHSVTDVVDLWKQGHSVSVLVDDYAPLAGLPMTVDATKTDEWIFKTKPTVGCLAPLGRAKATDTYSGAQLAHLLNN